MRKWLLLIPVCVLTTLMFFAAVSYDASRYMNNLDLPVRDTLIWITRGLGSDTCLNLPLPSKVVVKRYDELVKGWLALSPDPEADRKILEKMKKEGNSLGGYYNIRTMTVYLCEKVSTKEIYVHELVHHVFWSMWRNDGCRDIYRFFKIQEYKALELGARYVIEHRWSVRFLFNLGLSRLAYFKV
jgi:hypothetical protein